MGVSVLRRDGELLAYTIQKGFVYTANPYAPAPFIGFFDNEVVLELIANSKTQLEWCWAF